MTATAVLIHGCHLAAIDWERMVWGDPKNGVLGRAPKGIRLALKEKAKLIIWGTGASEKDGQKESCYTYNYAIVHASELDEFHGFDLYEVLAILKNASVFDESTQNTPEEIASAAEICREQGIRRLILVSSPTHIARCLQEAEKLRVAGKMDGIEVFATAADVSYADSSASDVVIVEPPHRGDKPKWQTYRYARAMFDIMKQGNEPFARFLFDLGELLKKYQVEVDWEPLA